MDHGPTLDRGPWTVDRGPALEDRGPWTVDRGPALEDRGPWTVDRGPAPCPRRSRTKLGIEPSTGHALLRLGLGGVRLQC